MIDSLSDFLTRIRNAYQARQTQMEVPYSRQKETIAKILTQEGFFLKTTHDDQQLTLVLKYIGRRPVLNGVKQISKPGLRVYQKAITVPIVRVGRGVTLVSTSQGVLTDKEARKQHLGGEVICQIW